MRFTLIKNAFAYTAELPNAETLAQHLAEKPFRPILETLVSSAGFVPNLTTAELVTPIAGGYSFTARYDEKLLPSSAIAQAVLEAVQAYKEENELEDVDKETKGQIHERIYGELVKRAITKSPTYVNCYYHAEDNLLIIPTTNKNLAQAVVGMLIECIGSVRTSTIWVSGIKQGLTTRLKSWLGEPDEEFDFALRADAFGKLAVGDAVNLKHKGARLGVVVDDLSEATKGLYESTQAGFEVENMRFKFNGMEFRLSHDFRVQGIQFTEELTEDEQEERYGDQPDAPFIWRTEAGVQLALVASLYRELCDMFGYKAPAEGAELAPEQKVVSDKFLSDFDDDLLKEAEAFVIESQRASISAVQRKLKIGYNRAARIIDALELAGTISGMDSHGGRRVLKQPTI